MLYMAVTADKYELPCFVADSGRELSKIVGIHEPYFWDLLHKSKPYKKLGMLFLKVEDREDVSKTDFRKCHSNSMPGSKRQARSD